MERLSCNTFARYLSQRACKTAENILLMPCDKAYLIEKGSRGELVEKVTPYAEEDRKGMTV